jgi:hypothetical protein
MRIEALETIKSSGYLLEAGDILTVSDALGSKWCANGWAKDTAGMVQTGERRVISATVIPVSSNHTQSGSEV